MERGWGQPSTYLDCFEWFLAPTDTNGLNPLPEKAPHVINNSWYCGVEEGCTDLDINDMLRLAVVNLKASGVVVVISNGNNGSQGCGSTTGPPAYFEESFSIGSTQESDTISNFSSRGPVLIDGSGRVKPNVSAPGQFIRSSTPNGNYGYSSGTSMAGPHVVGLVALILSANPALIGEVAAVEDIVESTAVPLYGWVDCSDNGGQTLPNNTYGYGRVDALAAVNKALLVDVPYNPASDISVSVFPNPASTVMYFSLSGISGTTCTLQIFSPDGRLVQETAVTTTGSDRIKVPVSKWSNGLYFWSVTTENGIKQSGKIQITVN